MSIKIVCGKCDEEISAMKMLKSVKDVLKHYNNKCPNCGQKLSSSQFSLDIKENK